MNALPRTTDAESQPDDSSPEPYFSVRTDVRGPCTFPRYDHSYFEILLQLSGRRTQHLSVRDIVVEEESATGSRCYRYCA
jgi:hypothetical protein